MAEKWQQWFPFRIDAFRGSPSVQAMHPAARAGYLYLLASAWQTDDCTLSHDPMDLADNSGLGDELWSVYGPRILRSFVSCGEGRIRNEALYRDWLEAKRVFESRQTAAKRTNTSRSANGDHEDGETTPDGDRAVTERSPHAGSTVTERRADTITETVTVTKEQVQKATPRSHERGATRSTRSTAFEPPDWVPREPWCAFAEMRKAIRAPLTLTACETTVRKLDKLRIRGHDPGEVLLQSVQRSWRGIFEIKEISYAAPAGNVGNRFQTRTERNLDAARQAIAELGGDAADSLGGEPPGDGEPANAETLRSSLVLLPPLRHPASA